MNEIQQKLIKKEQNLFRSPAMQAMLVTLVSYITAQVALIYILIVATVLFGRDVVTDEVLSQPWVSLALMGVSAIMMLFVVWAFLKIKNIPIQSLGFKRLRWSHAGYIVLVAFVYYIALLIIITLLGGLVDSFDVNQAQDIGYTGAVGWQLILAFIGLVILPPLAEEIVFRGILYRGLRDYWKTKPVIVFGAFIGLITFFIGGWVWFVATALLVSAAVLLRKFPKLAAAVFSAMLFGLVHMQWNVSIDTFLLSFALVWVYEKTGSLWAPIALHALKNGIAFVGLFLIT